MNSEYIIIIIKYKYVIIIIYLWLLCYIDRPINTLA